MRLIILSILVTISMTLSVMADGVGLVFENLTFDIKTISEDDKPVKAVFRYTNFSDKPIVITRADVTCGCTKPSYSKEPIMPNQSGEIIITFYPRGRSGVASRNTYVYTNLSGEKSSSVLKIVGVVARSTDKFSLYSYSIGNLRLKQQSVEFKNLRIGQRRKVRIQVGNGGDYDLKLSVQNLPNYMHFHCEPEVVKPDSVADLVFEVNTNLLDTVTTIKRSVYISGVGFLSPSRREIRVDGNVIE